MCRIRKNKVVNIIVTYHTKSQWSYYCYAPDPLTQPKPDPLPPPPKPDPLPPPIIVEIPPNVLVKA